jgi:hypothetical protein
VDNAKLDTRGNGSPCTTAIVSGSANACECGEDRTSRIRKELGDELLDDEGKEEEDKRLHPWRYWHTTNDSGVPF